MGLDAILVIPSTVTVSSVAVSVLCNRFHRFYNGGNMIREQYKRHHILSQRIRYRRGQVWCEVDFEGMRVNKAFLSD